MILELNLFNRISDSGVSHYGFVIAVSTPGFRLNEIGSLTIGIHRIIMDLSSFDILCRQGLVSGSIWQIVTNMSFVYFLFHSKNFVLIALFNLLFDFNKSFRSFIYLHLLLGARIVQEISFSDSGHLNRFSDYVIELRLKFIVNLGKLIAILIQISLSFFGFLFSRKCRIESFGIYLVGFNEGFEDLLHVFILIVNTRQFGDVIKAGLTFKTNHQQ